jgi:hypothetical protein
MRRLLIPLTVVVAIAALVAACSAPVTSARLQFSLSESGTLGYEVDDSGMITIASRSMRFRNSAGEHGVTITGYHIEFFDSGGMPINGGDNAQDGSVSIFVPPGILCDAPDEVYGCELGAPGWRFAPGIEVISPQSYQLLPVAVAISHIMAGQPIGWFAEISFTGFTATGGAFTTPTYTLAISPPD